MHSMLLALHRMAEFRGLQDVPEFSDYLNKSLAFRRIHRFSTLSAKERGFHSKSHSGTVTAPVGLGHHDHHHHSQCGFAQPKKSTVGVKRHVRANEEEARIRAWLRAAHCIIQICRQQIVVAFEDTLDGRLTTRPTIFSGTQATR